MHQVKVKMIQILVQKLSSMLSKLGAKSMIECIKKIENNKTMFKEQDHSKASYAKKISKEKVE